MLDKALSIDPDLFKKQKRWSLPNKKKMYFIFIYFSWILSNTHGLYLKLAQS